MMPMKRLIDSIRRRFRRQLPASRTWAETADHYRRLQRAQEEALLSLSPRDTPFLGSIQGRSVDLVVIDDLAPAWPDHLQFDWNQRAREWYEVYFVWKRNRLQEEQWRLPPDRTLAGVGLWSE